MNTSFDATTLPTVPFSGIPVAGLFAFLGDLYMKLYGGDQAVNMATGVVTRWTPEARVDRVTYEPLKWGMR